MDKVPLLVVLKATEVNEPLFTNVPPVKTTEVLAVKVLLLVTEPVITYLEKTVVFVPDIIFEEPEKV